MTAPSERIARYQDPTGRPRLGRVHGPAAPLGPLEALRLEPLAGDLFGELIPTGEPWIPVGSVRLLAPVLPSKIVGIGSNYRDHAAALGRPLPPVPKIFLKPPSSVIGPGDPIPLPPGTERVDHEAELAVVLGRTLSRARPDEAMAAVAGYTCLNDVTARDLQKIDGVFARAKGFDGFCPLGPWLARGLDPAGLGVRCRLLHPDGRTVLAQDGNTDQLVFGVAELLVFVSSIMTLWPGDVIATGTPAGVGPLSAGMRVQVEIDGIGLLENPVVERADRLAAREG
jgi:2-keto-4-pentenoate hydratase/2-oxohepta-3-ene-1,7-dioic acid hydratase in catechol pathway